MNSQISILLLSMPFLILSACGTKKIATLPPQAREVHFRFDSHKLLAKYQGTLDQNLAYLRDNPRTVIVLEGHTDPIGPATYNLDLGDRRARAVKEFFVKNGIDPKRVITVSYGEERSKKGRWVKLHENRRVVITEPNM